jgi:16S rRNA pseudouridine516 synthase
MRLDKFLSQSSGFSRKDVKKMLRAGEITVNDEAVRDPSMHISDDDFICLDGMPLEAPGERYLMLHKPEGCVCSNDDSTHPTVLSLIDLPRADELIICGRLDVDTTGLVLVTSDGQWAHKVTSPKHKTGKVYYVETADPIPESAVEAFAKGLRLHNEPFPTKPAELVIVGPCEARVTLTEGRYHQVKRMFAAIGNRVELLHRERIGSIELDPDLELGEYRELTEEEVNSIL